MYLNCIQGFGQIKILKFQRPESSVQSPESSV